MPSPETVTTVRTAHNVVQNKDYDWVLPVVILLALLVAVLFVLVILLYKKQWRSITKRSVHCSDGQQGKELDYFGKRHQPCRGDKGCRPTSFRTFSSVFNNKKNASTSFVSELAETETHFSNTNKHPTLNQCFYKEKEIHPQRGPNKSISTSKAGDTETWSNSKLKSNNSKNSSFDKNDKSISHNVVDNSFENNFEPLADQIWGEEKVKFYISTDTESVGVNNKAYWDSDNESLGRDQIVHTKNSIEKRLNAAGKFGKNQSSGGLIDRLETPQHHEPLDRQLSNTSAPVYSQETDNSSQLGRPLGKFETVHNLANSAEFEDASPRFDNNFSEDHGPNKDRVDNQNTPNTLKHQIPKIVLPERDYADFADHKNEDNSSYYNSSSLESCASISPGQSRRRIARANNPFDIEAVNIPRISSAPCLNPLEQESNCTTNNITPFSRSISAGHPLTVDKEVELLHSNLMSRRSSSSWSSEFFELVREAGITDQNTQRRMKKLIDDRYDFLFEKKYPELQSLYSPIQQTRNDRGYASEKKSYPKHRKFKARVGNKQTCPLDDDGYDRLKPPQIIYSEVRPPTKKKNRYTERRNSEPDRTRYTAQNVEICSSNEGSFRNNPQDYKPLDQNHAFSMDIVRKDKNVNGDRWDSAKSIYDTPWDLNVRRHGAFIPIKSLKITESDSSQSEPVYESIKATRSKLSKKDFSTDVSSFRDEDSVIYDHIHHELKDKDVVLDSNIKSSTKSGLPVPPSSPPPKNLNFLKYQPQITEDDTAKHRDTQDKQSIEKFRQLFLTSGSLSGPCVTDFPTDPVWRRSSNADIKIEPFDSNLFRSERSTSFIASSCDTPLEHPNSDDDDSLDDVCGRKRGQSFYKDVMYTHNADLGKDEIDNEDESDDISSRPFQRLTMTEDYDEPVQISRV